MDCASPLPDGGGFMNADSTESLIDLLLELSLLSFTQWETRWPTIRASSRDHRGLPAPHRTLKSLC